MKHQHLTFGFKGFLATGIAFVMAFPAFAATPTPWPAKPIHLLVGYLAGGSVDVAARVLANAMSTRLGQPVIVDNRAGADGTIAVSAVLHSPADGYTLAVSLKGAMTVAPSTSKLPFDPMSDLTPIAGIAQTAEIYVTRPRTGMRTLRDLGEGYKKNGNKLSIGYIGAFPRLLGELLGQETGLKLLGIPYKGLPAAIQDLLGDQTDMVVGDAIGTLVEQVKAGKLVALAVTSVARLPDLPEVPTTREVGLPALSGTQWYALYGSRELPSELVASISSVVNEVMKQPAAIQQLAKAGLQPFTSSPSELAALMKSETAFWKNVAAKANITPE